MLTLMYGKLRAQVNKDNKYDGKDNSFNIRTKAAVAGVRGTDFVTTFYPGEKSWLSEVYTFEGKVEFGGDAQEQKVLVPGGQTASFAISSPPPGEVTDMQLKSYIQKGALSEVRDMKEQEIEKLDFATDFKAAQAKPAEKPVQQAAVDAICSEPKGDFGQCSFTCEGSNPSGDSKCRTDLLNVRCVRRVCNANGQWAEATALPRTYGSFCQPERAIVRKDCSQY
jgi:hypothetical protein